MNLIAEINKAWNWKGFEATEIVRVNDFGNVIFKSEKDELPVLAFFHPYW